MKIGESGAVVALLVERAAARGASVHTTTYLYVVRYSRGRLYRADRTLGRNEYRARAQAQTKML